MISLTDALFKTYRRTDGLKFKAFLATAALGNSQAQKVPFRMLVVRSPCLVEIGDLIHVEHDEKILLLEHPSDNSFTHNFKAAYAKTGFSWKRPTQVLDPVTGFERESGLIDMGTLYVNFDTPLEDKTLMMTETEYRFLTGEDVQVKDIVGGKIVEDVQKALGVNLVHAT